jgi:hypothetical protein
MVGKMGRAGNKIEEPFGGIVIKRIEINVR